MDISKKILDLLLILAIVGYVAINLIADLPPFLIVENLIYATLYGSLLYWLKKTNYGSKPLFLLSIILGFNTGRVSRSIITPSGDLQNLAIQHIPLEIFLILTLAITATVFLDNRS